MTTQESYMLGRDEEESKRLDAQHMFFRQLTNGSLLHRSIDRSSLQTVADVGTGTGIWLREAARELPTAEKQIEFTGFDISAQQFPTDDLPNMEFAVHNVVESFPPQYHAKFDVVHVRFLSYALKAQDLETAVKNIVHIIRPGGYLQWQEVDVIDCWAVPDTPNSRSTVAFIISERIARELTPAITTPLIEAILSLTTPIPAGQVSPLCWTKRLMRIMNLETNTTLNHPSSLIQAAKYHAVKSVAILLLQAGILRRRTLAAHPEISNEEAQELEQDVEQLEKLLTAWNHGDNPTSDDWNFATTSIIARKALLVSENQPWMMAK